MVQNVERLGMLRRFFSPTKIADVAPYQNPATEKPKVEVAISEEAIAPNPTIEAFAQQLEDPTPISRRQTLRLLFTSGIVSAIAACTPARPPKRENPTPTARPIERELSTEEKIIKQKVQELNIQASTKEATLWKRGHRPPTTPLHFTETTRQEGIQILEETINMMIESENTYLQDAGKYYRMLKQSGELELDLAPLSPGRGAQTKIKNIITDAAGQKKILWIIQTNSHFILNTSGPIDRSSTLLHELEHVRNGRNFIKISPAPTLEQKAASYTLTMNNLPQQIVEEEARGYGTELQGYIYLIGLLGLPPTDPTKNEQLQRAAAFVRFGATVDNKDWQDYVRTLLANR